jgi:hypothetical protein
MHGDTQIIPALGRLKQEDGELEASLGYIASSRPAELHKVRPKEEKSKNNF